MERDFPFSGLLISIALGLAVLLFMGLAAFIKDTLKERREKQALARDPKTYSYRVTAVDGTSDFQLDADKLVIHDPSAVPPLDPLDVRHQATPGEEWVCAGLTERMIHEGISAWEEAQHDLKDENYISGITPDWDEGMIVAHIYKRMKAAEEKAHEKE